MKPIDDFARQNHAKRIAKPPNLELNHRHLHRVITIVITPRRSVKVLWWQQRFPPLNQYIASHNTLFRVGLKRNGGCRHKALCNMALGPET